MSPIKRWGDAAIKRLGPRVSPFYRAYPYEGPLSLTEVDIRGAVCRTHKFFFNRMPKVANSTLIENLAQRVAKETGRPVKRAKWYFTRPLFARKTDMAAMEDWTRAVFVRDPMSRALSAFRDKILGREHHGSKFWAWFGDGEPKFEDFCRYLEAGGLHDDIHWAPQTDCLLMPLDRFTFVGRFESLDADMERLFALIFGDAERPVSRAGPASTGTDGRKGISSEAKSMLSELYASDLTQLGYL